MLQNILMESMSNSVITYRMTQGSLVLFQCKKKVLNESDPNIPVVLEKHQFDNLIYIQNIAVHPQYKRYGLGTYLLQTCISISESDETCAGVISIKNMIISFFFMFNHQIVEMFIFTRRMDSREYVGNHVFILYFHKLAYYIINEKWEDAFIYFFSFHGATVVYPSKDISPFFLCIVVSVIAIMGLMYYSWLT